MGALKEYDPKLVNITWDGIDLNKGIAAGTFITITRTSRAFSLNVGADGGGTRVRNNDKSAVITLTVRMGSETNALLSDKIKDEELPNPTSHVAALTIKDTLGNTLHQTPQAFLDGFPDDEMADDESTRDWVFLCLEMNMDPRGSNEA